MGSNISRFIQTIFITSRIPEDLTRVKLVLIPNTPNLDMVSHLCPISLCNAFYKLLTKLLVNKLKPFLPYMIHPAQSGFKPGRRATDSYIIMQEILHCIHKQRGKTNLMAAKIVLDKGYDKLDWSFIKFTLRFYHFPEPVVDLILNCISSSSSVSILWNGQTSPSFCPTKGIRQGDPLLPYIFILCLNHPFLALDQALHSKQLAPIRVGRRPITFNHILFADDIFLFSQASPQDSKILFDIFSQFCQQSGQICNLSKSKLFFSCNTPPDIQGHITSLINMPVVTDLGKYLGMSLILKRKTNSLFHLLLDRIQGRIRSW